METPKVPKACKLNLSMDDKADVHMDINGAPVDISFMLMRVFAEKPGLMRLAQAAIVFVSANANEEAS